MNRVRLKAISNRPWMLHVMIPSCLELPVNERLEGADDPVSLSGAHQGELHHIHNI